MGSRGYHCVTKTHALIIMTALIPHRGHQYLIDFASEFCDKIHVIVSTRTFEPALTLVRVDALKAHYYEGTNVSIYEHADDDAPQNDDGTSEFWDYWTGTVKSLLPKRTKLTYLFSSEPYGVKFAEALGITHIPVDIAREIVNISGTEVRKNLPYNFKYVLPEMQIKLTRSVTTFGADSCGKTTMARYLAQRLNGQFVHEYARPYLESVGAELTDEKMMHIVLGQRAAMLAAPPALFQVRDTDALATIGYYRIFGTKAPKEVFEFFNLTKSNFYLMMPDNIPFEADPLRYGGDKRESTMQFWIDLLEEFDCKYYVIKSSSIKDQRREALRAIYNNFSELREIEEFERD